MLTITTQLSSEPGRDMFWDEHLVMVLPDVSPEDLRNAQGQTALSRRLEKTFSSFDWEQYEIVDAQGNGYGWDFAKGGAAFAAHMATHGFPGALIQPATYLFLRA